MSTRSISSGIGRRVLLVLGPQWYPALSTRDVQPARAHALRLRRPAGRRRVSAGHPERAHRPARSLDQRSGGVGVGLLCGQIVDPNVGAFTGVGDGDATDARVAAGDQRPHPGRDVRGRRSCPRRDPAVDPCGSSGRAAAAPAAGSRRRRRRAPSPPHGGQPRAGQASQSPPRLHSPHRPGIRTAAAQQARRDLREPPSMASAGSGGPVHRVPASGGSLTMGRTTEGAVMETNVDHIVVEPRPDGRWPRQRNGTTRAASLHDTQAEAEEARPCAGQADARRTRDQGPGRAILRRDSYGGDPVVAGPSRATGFDGVIDITEDRTCSVRSRSYAGARPGSLVAGPGGAGGPSPPIE